jgi:hypothetical protein
MSLAVTTLAGSAAPVLKLLKRSLRSMVELVLRTGAKGAR